MKAIIFKFIWKIEQLKMPKNMRKTMSEGLLPPETIACYKTPPKKSIFQNSHFERNGQINQCKIIEMPNSSLVYDNAIYGNGIF